MFTGLKVGNWMRKFVHYEFPIIGQNEHVTPTTTIPFTRISLAKGSLAPWERVQKQLLKKPHVETTYMT